MMQVESKTLRGRMYKPESMRKREKRILVLKTGLAGKSFHIENDEERKALENIEAGTELLLYREPDNEYDEWAIAVYLSEEDKIGYITRFKNETIARLMDAGKKFIAIVDEPEVSEDGDGENSNRVRHAYTENMEIPFSVYLIEE